MSLKSRAWLYTSIGALTAAVSWDGPLTYRFPLSICLGGLVALKALLSPNTNTNTP